MAFKKSDQDIVMALARKLGVSEIGGKYDQAGNVIRISLSNCHLTHFPLDVVRLTHLQQLSLHYNQLCELPSEIGQLTQLQLLGLSHNQLRELPPEIGRLTNLQSLDVSYNDLPALPPEIGQLSNLLLLDLSYNHFPVLPPQVKPLQQRCFIRNEVPSGTGWKRLQQAIDRIAALHATHASGKPAYRHLIDPPGQALAELYKQLHPDRRTDAGRLTPVVYAPVPPAPASVATTLLEHLGDPGAHRQEDIEQKTERCLHLLRAQHVEFVMLAELQHLTLLGGPAMQREFRWLKTLFVDELKTVPLLLTGNMATLQRLLASDPSFGGLFRPIRPY